MKKCIVLIVLFTMLISGGFSQKLDFSHDSITLIPQDGNVVNAYINIQNNTGDSLEVIWRVIEKTLNDDWFQQFCDFELCFNNDFGSLPDSNSDGLPDGYNDDWYLGIDPGGEPVHTALWVIEVEYLDYGTKDTLTWIVDGSTSSGDVREISHPLSLYPNPAPDRLNINAPGFSGTAFRVLDISGKEMQTGILNSENEVLNIEHLPGGLYFLSVQSESGTQVHKFIKQ